MISTESPGKIVKCGFLEQLAAASWESALTTTKPDRLFLVSDTPCADVRLVFPMALRSGQSPTDASASSLPRFDARRLDLFALAFFHSP